MSAKEINLLIESNKALLERLENFEKRVEKRFDTLETTLNKVLAFVSVGNEDIVEKLPKKKLQKA